MKMTSDILDIIHVVLDYKKFICSQNLLVQFHKEDFDWAIETEQYYYSLNLPEGMKKNMHDFLKILTYANRSEELIEMDNSDNLSQFEW